MHSSFELPKFTIGHELFGDKIFCSGNEPVEKQSAKYSNEGERQRLYNEPLEYFEVFPTLSQSSNE